MLTKPNIKSFTDEDGFVDYDAFDEAYDDYNEACIERAESRRDEE